MDSSKVNACAPRSVRVRLAKPEDAEGIKIVINSAFRQAEEFFIDQDRVDLDSVLNLIEMGKFLLAECDGALRGCVYVGPRPLDLDGSSVKPHGRAYLGLLAIGPDHQQSGLGSVLMDAAEEYCRGLGFNFMDLKVVSLRTELVGFYSRRGYVETGTSPFPEGVETKLPCHLIDMSKALNG